MLGNIKTDSNYRQASKQVNQNKNSILKYAVDIFGHNSHYNYRVTAFVIRVNICGGVSANLLRFTSSPVFSLYFIEILKLV